MTYHTITEGPLGDLSALLRAGPPSLAHLMALLDQGEYIQEFMRLVRAFLPEHEAAIMRSSPEERVGAFCRSFAEKYFELEDMVMGEDEDMQILVSGIPIQRGGLSYDEYHDLDRFSPAQQLLLALVVYPYYDGGVGGEGKAARVPLLEQCAKYVGEDLVQRIKRAGWKPEELHQLLDHTRFEGAAVFADWVWQQTETVFLDASRDYDMGYDEIPWSKEAVEQLTQEHQRAQQLMKQMGSLIDWLDDAPRENFRALLDFLLQRPPKEQLPLPLVEVPEE